MTCIHLKRLFEFCQDEHLRLGGSDLIRIVCRQCGEQEVCPSVLMDEYESKEHDEEATEGTAAEP